MISTISRMLLATTALTLTCQSALAGEAVLTVTHAGEVTTLDMDALQAMDVVEFETSTIWTEGTQTFTGVSLSTFLDDLGVTEGNLKATAINDYAVEIPVSDGVENGPIIAYMRNGELMSVRDKGPLWIVYPYDADPTYQTEVVYSRSIWQLDRIEVIE